MIVVAWCKMLFFCSFYRVISFKMLYFANSNKYNAIMLEDFCMDKKKLTREEALRRWNASKELKRKMSEKLERLVRESCKGRDDNGTVSVEGW